MNIYSVYRVENSFKLILDNNGSKYEVNINKKYDNKDTSGYFMVTINNKSLIKGDNSTIVDELDKVKVIVDEFLKEFYKEDISIRYAIYSKDKLDIEGIKVVDLVSNSNLSTMHESIYSNDNFNKEFEDETLLRKRYYSKQRKEVLSWEEYFMALARLTSLRSKDPSTQVGACIVDRDNRILSVGYNGSPLGIDDDLFPWERSGEDIHTKYMYVCHAEMNAIMNYRGSRKDLEGSTVYVDLFPCNECAKMIIQAGIKKVVYLSDKYANTDGNIASKRLLDLAGVKYEQLKETKHDNITLSLSLDK